jgi:hypothetical protein
LKITTKQTAEKLGITESRVKGLMRNGMLTDVGTRAPGATKHYHMFDLSQVMSVSRIVKHSCTMKEAAELLGVTMHRVRELIADGRITNFAPPTARYSILDSRQVMTVADELAREREAQQAARTVKAAEEVRPLVGDVAVRLSGLDDVLRVINDRTKLMHEDIQHADRVATYAAVNSGTLLSRVEHLDAKLDRLITALGGIPGAGA